jgi:branched-chain amino acid transport system substrate-binding protein
VRTYRRTGYAVAAVAAAALAAAGCSSSSSSSASSAPASSGAAAASSSSSAVSTASGSGGLGSQSVTNYLTYVGGKAGAANNSLTPVTVGYINEQGDANPPGALATNGAQMAVTYINKELGGVDGHPLKLDTCFTTTEEQGTTCADKFLADKSLPLVATGGVAVGAQSFFNTLNGKIPVLDGVAVTPFDAVAKNTVILFGDSTHVLGPMGTYATQVLHAKTASVIYPQTPGQRHQPDVGARGGARVDGRHDHPLRRRHRLREPGQGPHPAGHHGREEDRLRAAVPVRHGRRWPWRLPQVDVLDRQLAVR